MLPMLDPTSPAKAAEALPADLIDAEARAALDPAANVRLWIENLLQAGQPEEALRILARILPRKYALAWGCDCLRQWLATEVPSGARESDRVGLALAERWLGMPSEEHRRAALDFAERGDFASAGAWISAAAGWAEGSLAPKGYADVPAPESLCGEAVCAALLTAAAAVAESAARSAQLTAQVVRALAAFGGGRGRSA